MNSIDKQWNVIRSNSQSVFVKVFVGLVLGVLLVNRFDVSDTWCLGITLISLFIGIIYFVTTAYGITRYHAWLSLFIIISIAMGIGGCLTNNNRIPVADENDEERIVTLRVDDLPIEKENGWRISAVLLNSSDSSDCNIYGRKVYVNLRKDTSGTTSWVDSLNIGGEVMAKTVLYPTTSADYEWKFDYNGYLNRKGYSATAFVPANKMILVDNTRVRSFSAWIRNVQKYLVSQFESVGITQNNLATLAAITLGDKDNLSIEQKNDFSAAGASHILVVSGMHVGYIVAIIMLILSFVTQQRQRRIVMFVGLLVMWFYALLTGFAPSVVRATFMFTMLLLSKMLFIHYQFRNSIAFSAVILVLFNPNVIYDIGFQLSYAAVISIVYFTPVLNRLLRTNNIHNWFLRNAIFTVNVAVAAQILTAPLVILHFNQFPLLFVVTNIFVTIFAPVIFIGGLVLLSIAQFGIVGIWGGAVMNFIVGVFGGIIHWIASMPYALSHTYISVGECVAIYLFIYLLCETIEDIINRKNNRYWVIGISRAVVCLALLIVLFTENSRQLNNSEYLIVNDDYRLMVNVITADENRLFTDVDTARAEYLMKKLWMMYGAPEPVYMSGKSLENNSFVFCGESYVILRENCFYRKRNMDAPLDVDNLIVDRWVYPMSGLADFVKPKRIILTKGVWKDNISRFQEIFDDSTIDWHIAKSDGVYVRNCDFHE